jgi:NAD(P)-dependent dehydrogenase (short-subunit alcohol dehydrogenase family)
MQRLSGKKALVTGGARGIGEAIAAAFIAEGATVIVTDCDLHNGPNTAAKLGARFEPLDVANEEDWLRITERVPQIDIMVNNAGITGLEEPAVAHDPEHASLEAWRAVHAVNLDGTFLGCRYAIGAMKSSGRGSIINISSRSGMVGIPGAAAYAASKAAIRNHTKTVALYCADQGWNIRCNSLHPAAILTPMWEPFLGSDAQRETRMAALVSDVPMRRFGLPAEVAALAVLLASDEAMYLTGSEITLDGGLLAGSLARPDRE